MRVSSAYVLVCVAVCALVAYMNQPICLKQCIFLSSWPSCCSKHCQWSHFHWILLVNYVAMEDLNHKVRSSLRFLWDHPQTGLLGRRKLQLGARPVWCGSHPKTNIVRGGSRAPRCSQMPPRMLRGRGRVLHCHMSPVDCSCIFLRSHSMHSVLGFCRILEGIKWQSNQMMGISVFHENNGWLSLDNRVIL